jgi:hypothetical protein
MKNNQLKAAIATLAFAIPMAASAQSPPTPQKYCTMLSQEYHRYIDGNNEYNYLAVPGYGEAACKAHHPRAAIPPLERTLENAKLPLPSTPDAIAELPAGVTKTGGGA